MRDDGLRPIAVGATTEHLQVANDDHTHRMLEILDQHPRLKELLDVREREAFRAGFLAAMPNHTKEFAERSALLAYVRWIVQQ